MTISQRVAIAVFVFLMLAPVGVSAHEADTLRQNIREQAQEVRADIKEKREEFRDEVRDERKTFMEQVRERVSSKAGDLRKWFEGNHAAIANAKVTAVSDTTLTIEKDGSTYTVEFSDKTQFRRRFWGKSALSEYSVGDTVNVIGAWKDEAKTTIEARLIRNLSIQLRFGVFFGEVKSLLTNGWVMATKSDNRADQTVTVSADTKFVNRSGEAISQTDVQVDHRVRVKGLWNREQNTVTGVVQVKDFSLPAQAGLPILSSPTPTATP